MKYVYHTNGISEIPIPVNFRSMLLSLTNFTTLRSEGLTRKVSWFSQNLSRCFKEVQREDFV